MVTFFEDYCYSMNSHSNWLWFRRDSILPTTHRHASANIWSQPAGLVQKLWCTPRRSHDRDELFRTSYTAYSRTNPFSWQKKPQTSKLFFFSIPSYLNKNCRVKVDNGDGRRSSLFDGIEETLQSVKGGHILTLPKSERILKRNNGNKMIGNDQIPIPLVPVAKKFHTTGRLDGYLKHDLFKGIALDVKYLKSSIMLL